MITSMRLFLFFLLLPLAFPSLAFQRHFPNNGVYGELVIRDYPNITIDGKAQRLSPGARIWNPAQRTQTPNTLLNQAYAVVYTVDQQKAINRIWILSAEEVKQKMLTQ